jgi:hypothetical protein
MPTRIQSIRPLQEPFDFGLDTEGRARWAFNILASTDPSHTWTEEIAAILVAANPTLFKWTGSQRSIQAGSKASRPGITGAVMLITETGGTGPEYIQNQRAPAYRNPTAQLVASSVDAASAREMAFIAFDALAVVSNASVTPLTA